MKWTLLLLISLLSSFSFTQSMEFENRNIRVTYTNESKNDIDDLTKKVNSYTVFFNKIFNHNPQEKLSIVILPSVWHLTNQFSVNSLIGAVWIDDISFFQPLQNLKSMGKYEKTLFTEYSHHYIYSLSGGNIPFWFLEGISYILWLDYSNEEPIKGDEIYNLKNLKKFSSYMNDPAKLNNYYYSFPEFYLINFNSYLELKEFISGLRYNNFDIEGN